MRALDLLDRILDAPLREVIAGAGVLWIGASIVFFAVATIVHAFGWAWWAGTGALTFVVWIVGACILGVREERKREAALGPEKYARRRLVERMDAASRWPPPA